MQGLDRYITGSWGEDSVAPEFFRARDLGDQDVGTVIDLGSASDKVYPATISNVVPDRDGHWLLFTEELEFPVRIKADGTAIYYADKEG
jgi:hypothetical protein